MIKTTRFYILIYVFALGINAYASEQQESNTTTEKVIVETSLGNITVEIYPDKAPKTAKYFLRLVDDEAYRNATFYRAVNLKNTPLTVLDDGNTRELHIIQGGVGSDKAAEMPSVEHETTEQTGLRHMNGTISIARPTNSEFFITIGENPGADYGDNDISPQGYAAFGQVISGMDVVHKINQQQTVGSVAPVGTIAETLSITEMRKMQESDWEKWEKPQHIIKPVIILQAYRLRAK
jgi:peptidyl-prolyl cis-trans isomerase A (cyclophilin A)